MKKHAIPILALFLACALARAQQPAASSAPASGAVVKKLVEDFSGPVWRPGPWIMGAGSIVRDDDSGSDTKGKKCERADVQFSGGGGFENFSLEPNAPLVIPGDAIRLTARVKRSDPRFGLSFTFVDGWGRAEVNGHYLALEANLTSTSDWQTVSLNIPKDWVRPVRFNGVATHNFGLQNKKAAFSFWLADLAVETDLAPADPATGKFQAWVPDPKPADKAKALAEAPDSPLVSVQVSTPEICNVFSDTEPSVWLQVRNWKPGTLTGEAVFILSDGQGTKLKEWKEALSVDGLALFASPIEMKAFGLYKVNVKVGLSDGTKCEKSLTLAKVPNQSELTDEQKKVSPYGINYHSGGPRYFTAFKKAGIYWVRDYAWGLSVMRQARGGDRKYAGWPFYPSILRDIEAAGMIELPILDAIVKPEVKEGRVIREGPDAQWIRDIAEILITFPGIKYWELANEYDGGFKPNAAAEQLNGWENYQLYHQKFAELIDLLGDRQWTAVENGRAGIYPTLTEQCVKSGRFAQIGVVNCHHYCGTDAPEVNGENYNRGLEPGQIEGFFFDSLRATKRAASADGLPRQAWLTEFGWDTLAGPVVTPQQQAAFLQRGFLLAFSAGIDRAFWFYNFDAPKAVQIFDGCGLFTADYQPKLSLCAMAGLSSLLPRPIYVGSINAGPNTLGYVFRNDGQLVAGLWTIAGDKGPAVPVKAQRLVDYLGNPLADSTMRLGLAPVYAVGLDPADPLYRQTAYGIASPHLMLCAAGDQAEVVAEIKNNRDTNLAGEVRLTGPAGWSTPQPVTAFSVQPDQRQELKIPLLVSVGESLGKKEATLGFYEDGKLVKEMPFQLKIQRPFTMEVGPMPGGPGAAQIDVALTNRTATSQSGTLQLQFPSGWSTATPKVAVQELKPGETRQVPVKFTWSADWKDGESATAEFISSAQRGSVTRPIIPNQYRLHRARGLALDGQLGDWKAEDQLPAWMLGSSFEEANAKIWLAWAPEGLYGAVEVRDSKGRVDDPKAFWDADALELFVSTQPDQRGDTFHSGDHQFWAAPLFSEKRVYLGRWKVKDEIASTQFDLPGIRSAARRTADGYVMEFFLPASLLDSASLAAGGTLGLNLNLNVHGLKFDREVYWPGRKASGLNTKPALWGAVRLVE